MMKQTLIAMLLAAAIILSHGTVAIASGGGGADGGEGSFAGGAPAGFIGGGKGATTTTMKQTMQAVKDANQLEAQAQALEQAVSTKGKSGIEQTRDTVGNLMDQINEQADAIEAQLAEIKPKYSSPLLQNKINKLKKYVSNIRTKASQKAQEVM